MATLYFNLLAVHKKLREEIIYFVQECHFIEWKPHIFKKICDAKELDETLSKIKNITAEFDAVEMYSIADIENEIGGIEDAIYSFEDATTQLNKLCPGLMSKLQQTKDGQEIIENARKKIANPKKTLLECLKADFPKQRSTNIKRYYFGMKYPDFTMTTLSGNSILLTIEGYVGAGYYLLSYVNTKKEERVVKLHADEMKIINGPRVKSRVLDFLNTKDYVKLIGGKGVAIVREATEKWWTAR